MVYCLIKLLAKSSNCWQSLIIIIIIIIIINLHYLHDLNIFAPHSTFCYQFDKNESLFETKIMPSDGHYDASHKKCMNYGLFCELDEAL